MSNKKRNKNLFLIFLMIGSLVSMQLACIDPPTPELTENTENWINEGGPIPEEFTITWPEALCQKMEEKDLGGNLSLDYCQEVFTQLPVNAGIFAIAMVDVAPGDEYFAGVKLAGSIKQAGKIALLFVIATQGKNIENGIQVSVDEIYHLLTLADTAAPTTSPIDFPDWDTEAFAHAIEQRGLFRAMLAYEALVHAFDAVYFSIYSGKILVTTYDPYVGLIAGIFTGPTPVPDKIVLDRPITILLGSQGAEIEQVRMSSCMSWQIVPTLTYMVQYEPPPTGNGRCITNNN